MSTSASAASPEPSPSGVPEPTASAEREGGTERIIAFTDAAVAIALTLLVLPLMEAVSLVTEEGAQPRLGAWVLQHQASLWSFVMSFALVAVYWFMHHRATSRVHRFTGRMLLANFTWLFGIVLLPVTSAITVAFRTDGVQAGVYIGSLLLIVIALLWLQIEIHRHPVAGQTAGDHTRWTAVSVASILLLLIAWVIIVFTPLGYLGMWAMILIGPLSGLITRLLRSRAA